MNYAPGDMTEGEDYQDYCNRGLIDHKLRVKLKTYQNDFFLGTDLVWVRVPCPFADREA
jgi:hypothetical protein